MSKTIPLFGVNFNALTMTEAVESLYVIMQKKQQSCRYVVTANVNHCVTLRHDPAFRAAYDDATLRVVDSRPVHWFSKWFGDPLPGVITGSDLVPALFAAAKKHGGLTAYLLGAMPGVAEQAAKNIESKWPAVHVVGCYSPPFGFENNLAENRRIMEMLGQVQPQLLVIGLGAPKQELWIHGNRDKVRARAAICAGATIDFLAGEKPRAPRWMQVSGLEWLYRTLTEPKRLAGRYFRDALALPSLVLEEMKQRKTKPKS